MNRLNILSFGTFEVDNFGDLLFPLLAKSELDRRLNADITFVSPRGGKANFSDAIPTVPCSTVPLVRSDVNGVLLGGGNIVRETSTNLRLYRDDVELGITAYLGLCLTASDVATYSQVPLCWNAPGVPRPFSERGSVFVRAIAAASEYISVRDDKSVDNLRMAGVLSPIANVPDVAFNMPTLWSSAEIDDEYRNFLTDYDIGRDTIAIHINHRYVTDTLPDLAKRIENLGHTYRAIPILIGMGNCHGDGEYCRQLAEHVRSPVVVMDKPRSLRQIAACIARSSLYCGSSLHGFISAAAFGVKALLVADERRTQLRKFSGFLRHVGLESNLCSEWSEVEQIASTYKNIANVNPETRLRVTGQIDKHWDEITYRFTAASDGGRKGRSKQNVQADSHSLSSTAVSCPERNVTRRLLPSIDIVICVHNAQSSVEKCFASILESKTIDYRVIVVNDASDPYTTGYLRDITQTHKDWRLIENTECLRYTKSCNIGMHAAEADLVLLLNSDTVVTENWLERLVACAESSADIGIVGPFSNAASWQSLPCQFDQTGDWAINELPSGWSLNQMADVVAAHSIWKYPRLPFVNGFCMLVKRQVINEIGFMDEVGFPFGYGDEIDYCFRAKDAGYDSALSDHVFVYHKKSQSYGHDERRHLTNLAKGMIIQKYGSERIETAKAQLRENNVLAAMRDFVSKAFQSGN